MILQCQNEPKYVEKAKFDFCRKIKPVFANALSLFHKHISDRLPCVKGHFD